MPTVHCDVGHAAMLVVVKLVEAPGGDNGFHLTPSHVTALGGLERSDNIPSAYATLVVYGCKHTGPIDLQQTAKREEIAWACARSAGAV